MKYWFIGRFCQYFTLAKYQIQWGITFNHKFEIFNHIIINVWHKEEEECFASISISSMHCFLCYDLSLGWDGKLIRFVVQCIYWYSFDKLSFVAKLCRWGWGTLWLCGISWSRFETCGDLVNFWVMDAAQIGNALLIVGLPLVCEWLTDVFRNIS